MLLIDYQYTYLLAGSVVVPKHRAKLPSMVVVVIRFLLSALGMAADSLASYPCLQLVTLLLKYCSTTQFDNCQDSAIVFDVFC